MAILWLSFGPNRIRKPFFTESYSALYQRGNLNSTKIDTVKGALSGLRQFLATDSPLKMMKMLHISP